jgi:hypothetical protein
MLIEARNNSMTTNSNTLRALVVSEYMIVSPLIGKVVVMLTKLKDSSAGTFSRR